MNNRAQYLAAIEEEILLENQKRNVKDIPSPFIPNADINALLQNLRCNWFLNVRGPIVSHRKFIGPLIVFVKRLIRKAIKWYTEPICDQQTRFNADVLRILQSYQSNIENIQETLQENAIDENLSGR